MDQAIDEEYLRIIAEAIVLWTSIEMLEEMERDGEADEKPIMNPVDFVLIMLKRAPGIGGLALQAGADKHIPNIPKQMGWEEGNASEASEVQESEL